MPRVPCPFLADRAGVTGKHELADRFAACRAATVRLVAGLKTEDHVIQAAPEASPPKWHLAHTTWFFEEFVLRPFERGFQERDPGYRFLFNSYYDTVGPYFERARRGVLSRPTVSEILSYRENVTERVLSLLSDGTEGSHEARSRVEIGIQHEQQHQELLLTDILRNFAENPLRPAALDPPAPESLKRDVPTKLRWISYPEEAVRIGFEGSGFSFDNERPAHREHRSAVRIGSRLITSGEYLEFIEAGGYSRPELWLSDGWRWIHEARASAPLYWERVGSQWWRMTLRGMRPMEEAAPVTHVSYYEADAFARWRGARLPTEVEWESAARGIGIEGNFAESGHFDAVPCPETEGDGLSQVYGDTWEWTRSAYLPYPGYSAAAGALGEYNGKFMCNQMVLRGGSCATPASHVRASYRNFFPPEARWQFSGIRIALD